MQESERTFLVDVDLEELKNDFDLNSVDDQEWFSIIESFIQSFDQEREVIQLLGITKIHVDNPTENQIYQKSFFKLTDEERFDQIFMNLSITREEYYERLIHQTGEIVASKIRLMFSVDNVDYLFDFCKDSSSTIMKIDQSLIQEKKSMDKLLSPLNSVRIIEEFNLSVEELSYQMSLN